MARPLGSKNKSGNGERARDMRAAGKDLVLSLIRRSNEAKTRMQSISGELGAEIKACVEDKHLHAGALKLTAKLAHMDELKRAAFLAAFDLYLGYAKGGGLFGDEHAGDLVDDAASVSEQSEASTLGDIAADNARKLQRGRIKKIPEIVDNDPFGIGEAAAAE